MLFLFCYYQVSLITIIESKYQNKIIKIFKTNTFLTFLNGSPILYVILKYIKY